MVRFRYGKVPDDKLDLVSDSSSQTMTQASPVWRLLWSPDEDMVESWNPSDRAAVAGLEGWRVRKWAALPSRHHVRWLIPLDRASCAVRSLSIYTPYRTHAVVKKRVLAASMRLPFLRGLWAHDRLVVATRRAGPVQDLVQEVTGARDVCLAVSTGAVGRYRKITVQAMDSHGAILGFVKIPCTDAARARIRHEERMLRQLERWPSIAPHVPRVLFGGTRHGCSMLFISSGPPRTGPLEWGAAHETFESILHERQSGIRSGDELVQSMKAQFQAARERAPSRVAAVCDQALERAHTVLAGRALCCGLAHGDFAPWNTRLGANGLFVFDWEAAEARAPWCWDRFRFHLHVQALVHRRTRVRPPTIEGESLEVVRALFAVFLVSAMRGSLLEEVADWCPDWVGLLGRSLEDLRF
jgi:hypothetical protein